MSHTNRSVASAHKHTELSWNDVVDANDPTATVTVAKIVILAYSAPQIEEATGL